MQQITGAVAADWYTRRDGVVRGPFAAEQVTRYILLGRIRLDDELSSDRMTWRQTRSLATLLPAEMLNVQGWQDYQQLVEARLRVDERGQERRCTECRNCGNCRSERRAAAERRSHSDSHVIEQLLSETARRQTAGQVPQHRLRTVLLTLLLATLVFAWLVPGWR